MNVLYVISCHGKVQGVKRKNIRKDLVTLGLPYINTCKPSLGLVGSLNAISISLHHSHRVPSIFFFLILDSSIFF